VPLDAAKETTMKIAIINEGSTKSRNADVIKALESLNQGHEIFNLGMKNVEGEPDLNYLDTGFLAALVLNLKAVDFVLGGCGTGQGFMNAVLQFPGVACGLLMDPVDSFLYSQVNAGNCISFSLNKNYGLGGDLNLKYTDSVKLKKNHKFT
jgi:ribose 5-phosphate isomerase RpiB